MANNSLLINIIKNKIASNHNRIPFADFMELALYHPEFGYYNSPQLTIGKKGDFTTAPEISSLFAQCVANHIAPILKQSDMNNVFEIGAGTGRFAKDLISALQKLNINHTNYFIYEISSSLQEKQKNLLQNVSENIHWLDVPPASFSGTIIGNEILDAIPTHCFRIEKNRVMERFVTFNNDHFDWEIDESISHHLKEKVEKLHNQYQFIDGYESEINLNLEYFIKKIAQSLKCGIITFIDYGYGQREYYHPERHHGTLTCFHQHRIELNPFLHIGNQDITSHVDFTSVIDYASDAHCQLQGYTTQSAFLLDCGLLDLAKKMKQSQNETEQFHIHQDIKRLTMPNEMGDVVKVMTLSKNSDCDLPGFKLLDRRRDL
jgi:SAM-dependent MidA family methyltransferase